MRKVSLFMMVSLDGFFEGPNHELDWHNVDQEFVAFAIEQLDHADTLLFGRKTYEMMAEFWQSDMAKKEDPMTAERMNRMDKVVFSDAIIVPEWTNSRLVKRDQCADGVQKIKDAPGKDILILGSNNLAVNFIERGVLDEVRIMVNPIALGEGHSLFTGLAERFRLKLTDTKIFNSGNVLLYYQKG